MDKLKGKIAVELTLEQANEINTLVERSKPRALRQYIYSIEGIEPSDMCPACNCTLSFVDKFCPHCGQALDKDNYEL